MEWGNVTIAELVGALQEEEWSSSPRPLVEFFAKFTAPRSLAKWNSRFKCNLYHYRTNYFMLLPIILVIAFLRNPLALIAGLLAVLAIACLNDSFALSLSQKLTRMVRRISPHLAAKMRPPITPVIRGRSTSKRPVYIFCQSRSVVVLCIIAVALLVWFLTAAFLTIVGALVVDLACIALHATFRTPNLKARLNTYREEFRAIWRSYSEF